MTAVFSNGEAQARNTDLNILSSRAKPRDLLQNGTHSLKQYLLLAQLPPVLYDLALGNIVASQIKRRRPQTQK